MVCLLTYFNSFNVDNRTVEAAKYGAPGSDVAKRDYLRLMGGIVRMLIPIAMFAKPEDMCDPSRDLSMLAIQLLDEPELQSDAVEFLDVLTRHKLPFDVFAKLIDTIPRLSSSLLHPMPPATRGGENLPSDVYEALTFQRSDLPSKTSQYFLSKIYFLFCY